MAKNLQSKLKPSDTISIFDINTDAVQGLETEMKAASRGATVEIAASVFDASKDAVRLLSPYNRGRPLKSPDVTVRDGAACRSPQYAE